MNDHPYSFWLRFLPSASATALAFALLAAPGLHAQELWWDNNGTTTGFGTAGGTWSSGGSTLWSTNSTGGADATLGTSVTTVSNIVNFGTSTYGLAAGTITVSGDVSMGYTRFGGATGNITLSGGNITMNSSMINSGATTATRTITSNITLTGDRTIGISSHNGNTFILTGIISGGFGLTTHTSGGYVTLNGSNTFTGTFNEQRGQVNFNSIADAGQSSSFGAGSQITLGLNGGQNTRAWYTGVDSASSNRTWNIQSSATIIAQNGSLQLTGNLNSTVDYSMTIALAGTADTGVNEVSGIINDTTGASVTSVTVNNALPTGGATEAGFWILSGNNSYQGATTVSNSSRLRIAHANALGTTAAGTTVQNGSVLELDGGISVGAEALSIQGTGISSGGAMRNISGSNSYAGAITLAGATRINSDADLLTLSGAISGAQNLTFGGVGNTTVSGNITTSTGTLTKDGDGTLTISGAGNNYTGTTTVNAGTLTFGANQNLGAITGSGALNLSSYALTTNASSDTTYSGVISGANGALTKTGTGTLILSGANTYTGATAINAGTIQLGAGGTTGSLSTSSAISTGTGAVFSINRTNTVTQGTDFSGSAITGTGGFLQAGSGTTILNAANTYNGTTTINAGAIQIDHANALGSSGNITFGGGGLKYGTGITQDLSSRIKNSSSSILVDTNNQSVTWGTALDSTNAGGLTKNGTGTLTLSATNTYSGVTTINAGTLQIDGNIADSGLVINSGGTISPGSTAAADSFGTTSITINGGGYNWTLSSANGSAGTGWDQITSTGALTSSGLFTIYAYGTPGDWDNAANYSWNIFSAASLSSAFDSSKFAVDLSNFGIAVGNRTGTWSFSNPSGGNITLSYTASSDPVWTGGTGDFSAGFMPAASNGDNIAFSGAGGTATNNSWLTSVNDLVFRSGAGAYTIAGTALTVNGSIINSSLNTQTINTDLAFAATRTIAANAASITIGGAISGAGGLTKNGTNQLTLSGNNGYSGETTINAGALRAEHSNALGSTAAGTTVASGAALELIGGISIGAEALSLSGTGISSGGALRNISGDNSYAGAITLAAPSRINADAGLLTLSGGISGTQNLTIGGAGNTTVSGAITTSTGTLTKDGAGTLTLGGSNTYSGATTISGGTLVIGPSGRLGGGTYAGNIAINGISSEFIFAGTNSQTLSGAISGNGAFTMNGSGTLTLSGAKSYTGDTTINSGTLSITSGAIGGTGKNVIVNTGGTLRFGNHNLWSSGGNLTVNGGTLDLTVYAQGSGPSVASFTDATITGSTGNGYLRGVPTYNFSGTNNWSGGNMDLLTAPTINVISGTTTLSTAFFTPSGNNTVTKTGDGTLVLSAANTWTRGMTLNAGTLAINNATAIGAGTLTITGGTLDNTSAGAITLSNNNAQSWNGNFAFAGTKDLNMGTGAVTMNASRTVTVNGGNLTVGGAIGGAGFGLTKNGSGTLILSGASAYSGGTTLNTGTLVIGNAAAAGSGTITQANGASVLKLDTTGTIANAMSIYNVVSNQTVTLSGAITAQNTTYDVATGTTLSINGSIGGSGGVTKEGNGTLELNAANTFIGDTEINFGTLEANATGSLANTGNIRVNGGSLLVGASNAINDSAAMDLAGGMLEFNGDVTDTIGALTLSANSVIDMGGGNVALEFSNLVTQLTSTTRLNIYNYTLYSDHIYFQSNANLSDSLQYISFYSGFGTGFIGNSFIEGISPYEIRPVPEPETWATAALLLIGGGIYLLRRKKQTAPIIS